MLNGVPNRLRRLVRKFDGAVSVWMWSMKNCECYLTAGVTFPTVCRASQQCLCLLDCMFEWHQQRKAFKVPSQFLFRCANMYDSTGWSKSLSAPDDYNTESCKLCSKCPPPVYRHLSIHWTVFLKTMFSIAQSTFRVYSVMAIFNSSVVWGDCNCQVHRVFLITL
jgi:hypothetical protein